MNIIKSVANILKRGIIVVKHRRNHNRSASPNPTTVINFNTMNLPLTTIFAAGLVGLTSLQAEQVEVDCSKLGEALVISATDKPDDLLGLVYEKIQANESCACEIVTAAIRAAKADKALVKDIVFTAVSASQDSAVTIAECAIAAAPKAAAEVALAMEDAFNIEASGKMVVGAHSDDEEEDEFDDSNSYLRTIAGRLLPAAARGISVRSDSSDVSDDLVGNRSNTVRRSTTTAAASVGGGFSNFFNNDNTTVNNTTVNNTTINNNTVNNNFNNGGGSGGGKRTTVPPVTNSTPSLVN